MELENKDNQIYVINGNNDLTNILNNLTITDVFDVRDRTQKRLVLSKLMINNSKLLIESNFLKVVSIDINKHKIILELDSESEKIFRLLDNKVIDLLGDLLLGNSNNKINDIELNMNGDLTYVPLVSDDNKINNTFRLCLDAKTTLKYNKNIVGIENIKVDDMIRFLIEIESINLYPNELLCHIKPYCHMGEIYRTNTYKLNKRTLINNYTFSTDVENVFQKVVLDDQDISLIKTEVEPETNINSEHENNIQMDYISEKSRDCEESEETEKIEENINENKILENNEDSESLHLNTNNIQNNINTDVYVTSKTSEVNEEVFVQVEQIKPKRKYTKRNSDNKKELKQTNKPTNSRKKT